MSIYVGNTKVAGLSDHKVQPSSVNGNIVIDGVEDTVYTHPGTGTNPHGTTKADVGLSNVDNTTDLNKPISTATQSALNLKINTSQKGVANGVAQLDDNGIIPSSQLPSYVDDVLEYTSNSLFPATGESGKIYLNTTNNLTYRWTGSGYAEISPSIALGETSSTAYAGDKGKTTTDNVNAHIINTTNPHNVTKAQVGLGNVPNVDTNSQTPTYTEASTLETITTGEYLTIAFGKIKKAINILISHIANVANPHSVTKAQVGLGNADNTSDMNKPISTATQTALNLKANSSQVLTNVPSGALFTDTVYTHPGTHSPSIIAQDSNNRLVSDSEKNTWNDKLSLSGGTLNGDLKFGDGKAIALKDLDGIFRSVLWRNALDKTVVGNGIHEVCLNVPNATSAEVYNVNANAYQKIYHEGNKPSAGDVGAAKALTIGPEGFQGITLNDGSVGDWIRTTVNGLIPYVSGGASSSLGTLYWPFSSIYGKNIYANGNLVYHAGNKPTGSNVDAPRTDVTKDVGTCKEMRWNNYGSTHTIFDASKGITPTGAVCNNTNPGETWQAAYPTLMGYNGSQTYGVRVEIARLCEKLATTRKIGSASFDGTTDISLGGMGIGIAGVQGVAARITANLNNVWASGWYDGQNLVNAPFQGWVKIFVINNADANQNYVTQMAWGMLDHVNEMYMRSTVDGVNWTVWQQIAIVGRTPTIYTPALQNSWVNYDSTIQNVGYYKTMENIVHLQGLIKNGLTANPTVLFTLLEGFRPLKMILTTVKVTNGTILAEAQLNINTNGQVTLAYNSGYNQWLSLEGINFPTF